MREADVVEPRVLDLPGVPVLGRVGESVSHVRVLLVPVRSPQEHPLAVDPEASGRDLDPADPDARRLLVDDDPVFDDLGMKHVQVGSTRTPERR